jgi:hypothetical protein
LVAFLGTSLILLWEAASVPQLKPRQSAGFIILALAVLSVWLMLILSLSDATERLRRYADLLVPLGLFVTVSTAFNALVAVPALAAMLAAPWSVKLLTLSLSLSVGLVITYLLRVIYVGWTTALIFQVVVQGQIDVVSPVAIMGRWFWRALALELFGWGVLLAVSAVALAVGAMSLTFALVLLGVTSLSWNLLTAAVLPVALADTRSFWPALRHGLSVSRSGMRKWAGLVIAQMVLLGWITFIHVSYTTYETDRSGSEYSSSKTEKTNTNWGVNSFWTGGYADNCKWHESLMKSLESEPLGLIERLLTLSFAVLAIAIKIKIISDLYPPAAPSYEVASDGQLDLNSSAHAPSGAAV